MWVKAREREKNKEKHVNGAMFLTPTTTSTRLRPTKGLVIGIEVRSIGHPIGLPGTFWFAITVGIVNPVIYEGAALATMPRTLVLGHSQARHLTFPFVLTRPNLLNDRNQFRIGDTRVTPGIGVVEHSEPLAKILVKDPVFYNTYTPVWYLLQAGGSLLLTFDPTI
jgi:hypothetical protein